MNAFNLTWERIESFPIIYLDGSITLETKQLLEDTYHDIIRQHKAEIMIFDFSKLTYINSAGISCFFNILKMHNATGGKLFFTGLADHIKKVIELVGLTDYAQVFETNNNVIKYCNELDEV